ncbi:TraB/GumN family protein [Saccharicrinis aurantiacus]|uniref:TraB/GumN family protein n=1 Tax=Saccharicrinis aurantiacus TaxID=1849719 RepID=UPI00094F65F9|nr:TraB/GumN family protein [Saccharicrinis aurantiacus]
MKKLIISSSVVIVAIILFFTLVNFKAPTSTTANSGTLLWKISSDKQTEPSYLYGTIHLMPEKDFFLGEDALQTLKSATSLTLEVDIDLSIKEQVKMAQRLMLPDGKSLKDYMSKEDYDILYSYFADTLQIKESKIDRYFKLKPFNLVSLACMEYYDNIENYEKVFTKIAKKNKLNINSLESIDEQFNIIEASGLDMYIPNKDEIFMIKQFEELKEVYLTKNLDSLHQFMQAELDKDDDKSIEAKLLEDRNKNWIPKLDSIMQNESSFIAVGAAHLSGDNGIINLLKQKGYTVSSMNK